MEDFVSSIFSGIGKAAGKLFSSPLDFLSGKSCSSVCGPTWDLFCYIENFCIANLLKLVTVAFLFYIVLLFFYLSYQLGIFHCICGSLCRVVWSCFGCCFWVCKNSCYFLCYNLRKVKRKRRRRRRDIEELSSTTSEEEEDEDDESVERSVNYHNISRKSMSRKWRDYRKDELRRRRLRARSHKVRVGISGNSSFRVKRRRGIRRNHGINAVHDNIRVTQTSKFAQKGTSYKGSRKLRTRPKGYLAQSM